MTGISEHLESFLGPIQGGWEPALPEHSRIRAIRFEKQPFGHGDTFTTLGLSRFVLPMPNGREVRQELLLSVYPKYAKKEIASFLTTFAEFVLSNERALLRGDVVGPTVPLIPGVRASAIYASLPTFFAESFATFRGTQPPTVIVWLIPLVGTEPQFIRQSGWEAFEDVLESRGRVDLWNLDRDPVV